MGVTEKNNVIQALAYGFGNGVCKDHEFRFADMPESYNVQKLMGDALEILIAREPHVLTLEEVKNRKEPMFLETKSFSDWCLLCHSNDESWFCVTMRDGSRVHYFGKLYGKSYRCWTSRPTDGQKEGEPWN